MASPTKKFKSSSEVDNENFEVKNNEVAQKFLSIEKEMCEKLLKINYENDICYIYNPIDHAEELHTDFLNKYCHGNQPVLLLGMNPGPWGMSQTGVCY